MARIRMVEVGLPYKKILQGSKWIGRVYKNAQGTWTGQIGKDASRIEATAATPEQAFNEVGARYFGQPNAAALATHNSAVRHANRQQRASHRSVIDDFLRRLDNNRVARGRALRAEEEVNRLEQEANEDDFVPPVGRRH